MGIFINYDKHPDVFKNNLDIKEPNQEFFEQDYLSEMIEKQKQANDSLRNSFQELETAYQKQTRIQSKKMTSIRYHLKKLDGRHIEQKEIESDVINSLEKYGGKNEELVLKMDQQMELQQKMAAHISKAENRQHEMINRIEKQEALSEKMGGQLDNLRSALYERTHYLAEKIEESYNATSSYIYKIISGSGSDLPTVRYKLKRNEKNID